MIYAPPPPHTPPAHEAHYRHGRADDHDWARDRLYWGPGATWDYTYDQIDATPAWWTTNTQWIIVQDGIHYWRAPSGALLRVHLHR